MSIIKTGADDNEIHDVSRAGLVRQTRLKATHIYIYLYFIFYSSNNELKRHVGLFHSFSPFNDTSLQF